MFLKKINYPLYKKIFYNSHLNIFKPNLINYPIIPIKISYSYDLNICIQNILYNKDLKDNYYLVY